MHKDINLFYSQSNINNVALIDFRMAKYNSDKFPSRSGSISYALEIFTSNNTFASDIWSLVVVLHISWFKNARIL